MPLLDFPPEVFENVAHELVSIAGVGKAWKLRGVCREYNGGEVSCSERKLTE